MTLSIKQLQIRVKIRATVVSSDMNSKIFGKKGKILCRNSIGLIAELKSKRRFASCTNKSLKVRN